MADSAKKRKPLTGLRKLTGGGSEKGLDKLVHERMRLGILSALAVNASQSFRDLQALLGASDGNLSVHARKLEDAGYVRCRKSFEDRKPKSVYQITAKGRRALTRYLDHMEDLIRMTRGE
jgi:DNA-binding MarR family transcriptional regulator